MIAWMLCCAWMVIGDRLGSPWIEHDVDLIELNHYHRATDCGCDAKPIFTQVIFWRLHAEPKYDRRGRYAGTVDRFHTCGYLLVSSHTVNGPPSMPEQDAGGMWRVRWGRHMVRAPLFRESHTTSDPERDDVRQYPYVDRPNMFETVATNRTNEHESEE